MVPGSEPAARILVVKLGALGDIVLALGPFAAIRQAHPDAHITLLTTRPYVEFLKPSGYFDDFWVDDRPSLLQINRWRALRQRLRGGRFVARGGFGVRGDDRCALFLPLFHVGDAVIRVCEKL